MRERWIVQTKRADFAAIAARFNLDPLIARLIRNRGLTTNEEIDLYLNGTLSDLHDPGTMKDACRAARLIDAAIRNGVCIGIASDFDNDGIFSSMVLYEGIRSLGGSARIYTPHRILEGYGLNDRIVRQALAEGCGMLLTCDNGIAAFEPAALAKSLGMQLIITDHHEIPYREENGKRIYMLPEADAVVDPWQEDCPYPYKNLCGTGVVFKLMQLLYGLHKRPASDVMEFLDYTAIATVADVMELTGENRILVREGLKRLARTGRPGLKALMDVTGIQPENLNSYHIGFILGPCFNAAGRLDTVQCALELLQSRNYEAALPLAMKLKEMNEARKDLTKEGVEKACAVIETAAWKSDSVYLVYLGNCHESVSGIIAGRLRERYGRPVLVFADAMEEGMIKASGRSIEAYHMFDGLSACRDLFERFGGHAMAAGLTMKKEYLEELRKRLNDACTLTAEDLQPLVMIDSPLPLPYISERLIGQLKLLEPFGRGNEKPLFAGQHICIRKITRIGKNRDMLKLSVSEAGSGLMDALYFGDAEEMLGFLREEYGPQEVEAALRGVGSGLDIALTYYPQVNEFRGALNLQIVIQNYCRIPKKRV